MRPNRTHRILPCTFLLCVLAAGLLGSCAILFSAEQKQLSVYAPQRSTTVPVTDIDGKTYVAVSDVLQIVGAISAKQDGKKLKLRLNDVEGEFKDGSATAKVHGKKVEMEAPFRFEGGSGLVVLSSLPLLISNYLGVPAELHPSALRLFIGTVGVNFAAQLTRHPADSLVLNFSAPVNPTIASEPGKLRLVFQRDPILDKGSSAFKFDSATISALNYSEASGTAELTISGSAPLIARFSSDRKTITIVPVEQLASPTAPTTSAASAAPLAAAPQIEQAINVPTAPIRPIVIIDAGHGGSERGAALSNTIAEKDVTLAVSRRLRNDLQARGISILMLRDSDITLTADQRAALANGSRARIYIGVHAADMGQGVRIYTDLLPPVSQQTTGPFIPWSTAQGRYLGASEKLASAVSAEVAKTKLAVRSIPAPLPPMNSIAAAAITVEIAPSGEDVNSLASAAYQEQVAGAVAAGVAGARSLGVGQ